jgi:Uma2 family endonuclease
MATATQPLTLEQFHESYSSEKGYEYWGGEVVHKGLGTVLHGRAQAIIAELLRRMSYDVSLEVDLRFDPDWEPRPDILVSQFPLPATYPTDSSNLFVCEVLSPDDALPRLFRKCRNYTRLGIEPVFVIDPEARDCWRWSREMDNLERITQLHLPGGKMLELNAIWNQLDK